MAVHKFAVVLLRCDRLCQAALREGPILSLVLSEPSVEAWLKVAPACLDRAEAAPTPGSLSEALLNPIWASLSP